MNTTKKLSTHRYILHINKVILFMCGLTLLLSSCELDRDTILPGEKISVKFSIAPVDYGVTEDVTRSMSNEEPETAVIPLGNGLFMQATLEPDREESMTRAATTLPEGTLVCIAVYKNSDNSYVDSAIDTVKHDGKAHHEFTLNAGTAYNFVAYTYLNPDSTDVFVAAMPGSTGNPTIANIAPAVDLLYGNRQGRVVQNINGGDTVQIPVWHLFSRIREVRTVIGNNAPAPKINDMGEVSIGTFKGNLQVATASYDSLTGATTGFTPSSEKIEHILPAYNEWTGFSSLSAADSSSVHRSNDFEWLVFPGTETSVSFSSITIGGDTYPDQADTKLITTFFKKLASGRSYALRVTFTTKPDVPPGVITTQTPYVGAFWRWNEKGERIIRIKVDNATPAQWVASVAWVDGQWTPSTGDGILLMPGGSPDTQVSYTSNITPGDAEDFPLTSGYTSINGSADEDNPILFRIGLQKQFTAYNADNNPARYALVKIFFDNKAHTLYLRQGEGADYAPGQTSGARWSPYNLGDVGNPGYYPDSLVHFPSQSGYMYQWAYSTTVYTPKPHHPVVPSLGAMPGWLSAGSAGIYSLDGVCPAGYAIPTGNNLGGVPSGDYALLISSAPKGARAWGYYADGFFDRRSLNPEAYGNRGTAKTSVSYDNDHVAYIGQLFFNAASNASIFFPVAGFRSFSDGHLDLAGGYGIYYTSSPPKESSAWMLELYSHVTHYANLGDCVKSEAASLRCVKPAPGLDSIVDEDMWNNDNTIPEDIIYY